MMPLKKNSSWFVKNKVIVIFFLVSFLPILYAIVKIVLKKFFGIENFGINLRRTIDFDWLAYYGSIIGSYLIVYTLKIENTKYREEKRDSVRPIWNVGINYDSMQQLGNDSNNRNLSIYSKNKICVDYAISRYNYIKINTENTQEDVSSAILIKIRNIGLGHALIDEIKCVEKYGKGSRSGRKLEAEERFMIDKGHSNNLLLHFESKIEDIEKIKIFFIDILENKYVYDLKLEGTNDEKSFVNIGNKRLYLFSLTNAFFESYFPDLVEKDS